MILPVLSYFRFPCVVNSIPVGPIFVQVVTNFFYLRKSVMPCFLILFPGTVPNSLSYLPNCYVQHLSQVNNHTFIYVFIVCLFLLVSNIHKGRSNSVYNFLHNVWLVCSSLWKWPDGLRNQVVSRFSFSFKYMNTHLRPCMHCHLQE